MGTNGAGIRGERYPTLDQAAAAAFRLASKWGGEFLVLTGAAETSFLVRGSDASSAEKLAFLGLSEQGRASSLELTELRWTWAEGRGNRPAPPNPFDAPEIQAAAEASDAVPEDVRQLALILSRVMRAQQAMGRGLCKEARRILGGEDEAPARPAGYLPYLALVREKGMILSETERLSAAADGALAVLTAAGSLAEASDILHGRVVPSAPAAARRAM